MKEYQLRQEAVSLHLQGQKVTTIAQSLGRSRKWVYHWIRRFSVNTASSDWFKDESKAPKKPRAQYTEELEQNIVAVRHYLEAQKMAQIGAISIQYELERRGVFPVPAIWTINRVIAKHDLNNKSATYKSPKEYPELFVHTHQMDLVGPRYIKGDGRYYSVNLIDATNRCCFVKATRTKSSEEIVQAIASFWKHHGMPDALQMDNELAFRGSNRYPRSFGSVVRFALSQGVAPVFIPVKEPWRNGIIEKFNHTYQKRFVQMHTFNSFNDLSKSELAFIDFHNNQHRYSSLGHKTPNEAKALALPPIFYDGNLHLPDYNPKSGISIPLTKGCVYYIRFIRSDLKLHLPNESFDLVPSLKYSYVVAEINIENHCIFIKQNQEIKQIIHYQIPAVDW